MAKIRRHQGHLVIDWRDSKGKRHFERVADREAGKRRLAEILRTGEKAVTNLTFQEYALEWLAGVKGEIAASTYQGIRGRASQPRISGCWKQTVQQNIEADDSGPDNGQTGRGLQTGNYP